MPSKVIEKLSPFETRIFLAILLVALSNASVPAMGIFYILGDFGGGVKVAAAATGVSLLGVLITKPLGVSLAKRVGYISTLKFCLFGALVCNLIAILSPNYITFLVSWFLHGLFSGPIYLVILLPIRKYTDPEKVGFYTQWVITILLACPLLGGSIGALFAYYISWKIGFMFYIGLYSLCLVWLDSRFKQRDLPKENIQMNWVGCLSYSLAVACLGFCLTFGLVIDGFRSVAFNALFSIGSFFLIFFLIWNHYQKNRFIDYNLSRHSLLVLLVLLLFVVVFMFHMSIVVLLSHWLHLYVSYSMQWVGLLLLISLVGPILIHFASIFTGKMSTLLMISLSVSLILFISYYVAHFNVDVDFFRILVTRFLDGIVFACFFPAGIRQLIHYCEDHQVDWAICFFTLAKTFGSFFGISLISILWEKRNFFYYSRLGGDLTPYSENTNEVLDVLNNYHFSSKMKILGLSDALERQSRSLALDDCFYFMGWVMLIFFVAYLGYFLIFNRKSSTEKAVKTSS